MPYKNFLVELRTEAMRLEKPHQELWKADSYPQNPDQSCNLVLKGGITSGVTYPYVVCVLARSYRLKQIGGTSAGAIAAVFAAAAEYRRATSLETDQGGNGYALLAQVIEGFAGANTPFEDSGVGNLNTPKLMDLFQPTPKLQHDYRLAVDLMRRYPEKNLLEVGFLRTRLVLRALIRENPLLAWTAPLLLLGLALLLFKEVFLGIAISAFIILYTAYLGVRLFLNLMNRLHHNGNGFIHGATPWKQQAPTGKPAPLMDWIETSLRTISNLEGECLTFGMLEDQGIELKLVTTALTVGSPKVFPDDFTHLARDMAPLYFKPEELSGYVSPVVIDHLIRHARPSDTADRLTAQGECVYALPLPKDLPISFAARCSLSFPVLFAMVPLLARDPDAAPESLQIERFWLTDGGITSNFPVHLFHHSLPQEPTFAINLRPFPKRHPRVEFEFDNTYVLGADFEARRQSFRGLRRQGNLLSMFSELFSTAQSWMDHSMLTYPGHRERILHLNLAADEGGLNLNMDADAILKLAERGYWGGRKLVGRFDAQNVYWPGYRRTRMLHALQQMALWSEELHKDWIAGNYEAEYNRLFPNPNISHTQLLDILSKASTVNTMLTDDFRHANAWRLSPMGRLRSRPVSI